MCECRVGGMYVLVYRTKLSLIWYQAESRVITEGKMLIGNFSLYRAKIAFHKFYNVRQK